MTLKEIKIDLFEYEPTMQNFYYLHCISRDFELGLGIAKSFRNKFNLTKEVLAKGIIFNNLSLTSNVFNLITKSKYWQKPTYDSLRDSLISVKKTIFALNWNNTKDIQLIMSKIGCGLDKLMWKNVKNIIKEVFGDTELDIVICYL